MKSNLVKIGKALLAIHAGLLIGGALMACQNPRDRGMGFGIWVILAIYGWIFSDANADVASRLVFWAKSLCIFGLPLAAIIWLAPRGVGPCILLIGFWSFPLLAFVGWVLGPHDDDHGNKATHLRGRSQTSMGSDPIALRRKQRQCQAQVDEDERHV